MLALPLMPLLFPPRYTGAEAYWGMVALYRAAKLLELADACIGERSPPEATHGSTPPVSRFLEHPKADVRL